MINESKCPHCGKVPFNHELKTWDPYWTYIRRGEKQFDIRKNDRDFHIGDILKLTLYNPETGTYGAYIYRRITYILHGGQFGLEEGYVALSLEVL